MSAVRKSEPVITIEGFFGAKGVAIRMKGQRRKVKDAQPAKEMTLGQVRKMLDLTIEQMAEAIGTKKSTYWFWEQGRRTMPEVFETRVQALVIKHSQAHPAPAAPVENGHDAGFPTK